MIDYFFQSLISIGEFWYQSKGAGCSFPIRWVTIETAFLETYNLRCFQITQKVLTRIEKTNTDDGTITVPARQSKDI
ncbi:MAG: hypothetical protein QM653_12580 [Dysgonomonas sp.]|uniref:hypothetical protein n=1 Tax=Dysgonomonas sp. TaxID=1891233 RepID=UPI0039E6A448